MPGFFASFPEIATHDIAPAGAYATASSKPRNDKIGGLHRTKASPCGEVVEQSETGEVKGQLQSMSALP